MPDVAAPGDGLARIERALTHGLRPPGLAGNDNGPDHGQVQLWRGIAIASSIAATLLLAVALVSPRAMVPGADAPSVARAGPNMLLVAQIQPVAKGQSVPAVYDPATGRLRVAPAALVDAGHSPELWVIPADGVPRSLGLIAAAGTTQVSVPAALQSLVVDGAILAVSLELAQGAPHTAPSSTPIATGKISTI